MDKNDKPRKGGMPKGWRKAGGTRAQHQLRAYPDEWIIIKAFAKVVKYGDKEKAKDFAFFSEKFVMLNEESPKKEKITNYVIDITESGKRIIRN